MQTLLDKKEKEVNGLKVDLEYCETLLAEDTKELKLFDNDKGAYTAEAKIAVYSLLDQTVAMEKIPEVIKACAKLSECDVDRMLSVATIHNINHRRLAVSHFQLVYDAPKLTSYNNKFTICGATFGILGGHFTRKGRLQSSLLPIQILFNCIILGKYEERAYRLLYFNQKCRIFFENSIQELVEKFVPTRPSRPNNQKAWVTSDLKSLFNKRDRAFKCYKLTKMTITRQGIYSSNMRRKNKRSGIQPLHWFHLRS